MNAKRNRKSLEPSNVMNEKSTKMKTLDASIDLFAQRGFDAVSMQEIADAVGIKKASLYYHFASKDQILKDILVYPMERLGDIGPQGVGSEEMITSMGVDGFMRMSIDVVLKWMEAPYVDKIMRITFVELYHNDQVKKFFADFVKAAEVFWTQNFTIMMEHNLIKPVDPQVLAAEYLSFYSHTWLEYYLHRYDPKEGSYRDRYGNALDRHTDFLISMLKT